MEKIILPGSWDFGDAVTRLVKSSSRGLVGDDASVLVKRASAEFVDRIKDVDLLPGDVPVHLIAMGSTESYGPNRNGDGFKEASLKRFHDTFVKLARFYRHHKNKDKSKSYGRVKLSYYNEPMGRVELLALLNGTKEAADRNGGLIADRELDKLASGDDLAVSMACVTDPNYPVLVRDQGYVPISEVVVGDHVWSHAGKWRKVTQLTRRKYTGEVHKFKLNGLPMPVELTADHPMMAMVFAAPAIAASGKTRRRSVAHEVFDKSTAAWHPVSNVTVGDRFMVCPVGKFTGYGEILSVDLARLMGFYLADGSLGYNGKVPSSVNFCCGTRHGVVREIPRIVDRLWPDVNVGIRPHALSDKAMVLNLCSTSIATFFAGLLRTGSRKKLIPPEIFNSSQEVKLAFLGAWLDCDGWLDKKGLHWSTCSRSLALQGRDLLLSIGLPPSIYTIDHAKCDTSGYENSSLEYSLNLSHLDGWCFGAVSTKSANYGGKLPSKRTKPPCLRLHPDGLYAVRVKSIESRHVVDLVTYNFEVEEDHSYSLGGLVSHNCKIDFDYCSSCGNKAASRNEYCDHDSCVGPHGEKRGGCKHNLTKVGEDGHVLHVDNPRPSFFDISGVMRPADRIAYGFDADYAQKAASADVIGGAELAEQLNISSPLDAIIADISSPSARKQAELAYKLASLEDDMGTNWVPGNVAHALALDESKRSAEVDLDLGRIGSVKLAASLAALADRKVLLPLGSFLALITGQSSEKSAELADRAAPALPGVFNRLISDSSFVALIRGNPYLPGRSPVASTQRRVAESLYEKYSLDSAAMNRRCWISALREPPRPTPQVRTGSKSAAADEVSEGFARQYALYKLAFLTAQSNEVPLTARLLILHNYLT